VNSSLLFITYSSPKLTQTQNHRGLHSSALPKESPDPVQVLESDTVAWHSAGGIDVTTVFAIVAKRDASEKRTTCSSHGAKQLIAHIAAARSPSDNNMVNTVLLW